MNRVQEHIAARDYERTMRALGPRYLNSRDLIKQMVIDTTREIYPERSQHWLARAWRLLWRLA